jgi:mRNA export factor
MNFADVPITDCPHDSVSALQWVDSSTFLVSSWDQFVYTYKNQKLSSKLNLRFPILTLTCSKTHQYAGACDGTLKMWSPIDNKVKSVPCHDNAVSFLDFVSETNCIVTGSWDGSLKLWKDDQRIESITHSSKILCGKSIGHQIVIGTQSQEIFVYDVRKFNKHVYLFDSAIQIRSLDTFDGGVGIGGVEGRVSIQYYPDEERNFTFKCHRIDDVPYPVHSLHFHPIYKSSFSTTGGDGSYHFWERDSKTRSSKGSNGDLPIVVGKFNPDGTKFVYAYSYDWSKGEESHVKDAPICVHIVNTDEIC